MVSSRFSQSRFSCSLADPILRAGTWKQCPEGHEVGDFTRQSEALSRSCLSALLREFLGLTFFLSTSTVKAEWRKLNSAFAGED